MGDERTGNQGSKLGRLTGGQAIPLRLVALIRATSVRGRPETLELIHGTESQGKCAGGYV